MEGQIIERGKLCEVTDNNHHASALKALKVIVDAELAKIPPGERPPCKTRHELELVKELFGGDSVPDVPVEIVKGKKLYLERRDGTIAAAPPRRFADLEDNPYRYLASQLCGKVSIAVDHGEKVIRIKGADNPVWLKVVDDAPDYIEFRIAKAIEA